MHILQLKPSVFQKNQILFHIEDCTSFNDLIKLLEENWKEGGYQYNQEKEQHRQDAEEMLKNYWEFIKTNPVNKLFTEHWFEFETDYAKISGKCDRIDIDANNNISIIADDLKIWRLLKKKS